MAIRRVDPHIPIRTGHIKVCQQCTATMRHDTSNEGIDGNLLYSERGLWGSIIHAVPFRRQEIQNGPPLAGLTGLWDHPKVTIICRDGNGGAVKGPATLPIDTSVCKYESMTEGCSAADHMLDDAHLRVTADASKSIRKLS